MSRYQVNEHKRGDTFVYAGFATVNDKLEQLENYAGWVGVGNIRDEDYNAIDQSDLTWLDVDTGACEIRFSGDPRLWPDRVKFDITFTSPTGDVVSTPTLTVLLCEEI